MAQSADAGSLRLDDVRSRLNALLAHSSKPEAPARTSPPEPAAAVDAALKALESRIDEARARLGPPEAAATGEQIARLEAQLADIGGRLAATEAEPQQTRRDAELAASIREISLHQRTLDDRAETLAMRRDQKALSAAMAALRTDIAALGEQVGDLGRLGAEERGAFFDIARRIDSLAAETPVDRNLLSEIRGDLEALRAMVEGGARQATLDGLAARNDEIAAQINALVAGSPNRRQVEALGEEVAALRQALETDDSPRAIARLEARLAGIGRAVDAVLAAQQAPVEQSPVLEQLEERLREINSKVDSVRQISDPAAITTAVDGARKQIEMRLEDLVSRLGGLFATVPRQTATLEALQERLQGVVERIDGLGVAQIDPSRALEAINAEIRALRAEIAERPAPAAIDTEYLEGQIRELAAQLDTVAASGSDGRALIALERQVERLAGELEETRPRLAAVAQIESNLERLQALLADTTRESIVGARAEAQQAVSQLSEIVAEYEIDADVVRGLMRDLDALKGAAGTNDEATRIGLESVSQSVAEIVERLGRLERATLGGAAPAVAVNAVSTAASAAGVAPAKAAETPAPAPENAIERRADFIAAARRAARAAAERVAADKAVPDRRIAPRPEAAAAETPTPEPRPERKAGAFARISQAIRNRKRPLLLAAAAIVIAIGAMQIYGKLGTVPDQEPLLSAAEAAPEPPANQFRDVAAVPAPATVPTVPRTSEAALVAPAARPSNAVAFAEPEAVVNRFTTGPSLPDSSGFAARQAPAADGGNAPATLASASTAAPAPAGYASGLDPRLGPEKLLRAADDGDPVAAFEVARRYAEGSDVGKDLAKAAHWYRRAAEGGVAVAQYRLASLYERGQGVERSRVDAANWYQRAADQGNVNAMHNLAVMMSEGVEGPPDHDKALQWFLAAGHYGVRDSQYNLGVIYARGLGPAQDLAESYKWFALAAIQGDTDAASRREEVAKAMSPEELARAKAASQGWRVQPTLADANGVAAPAGGWDGPGDGLADADREALIRKIQVLLAEQGYDPGPADGVVGPKTVDAVRAYQRRIGQPETGQIDGTLIAALAEQAM
jgi:localization factor PodJL